MVRVGINGFGRIGRMVLRAAWGMDDVKVVAVNDLGDPQSLAHLLQYDSVHGIWNQKVEWEKGGLRIGQTFIPLYGEKDPERIPWEELGVELVIEATGRFTKKEKALSHCKGGAKRVLITAPAEGADLTLVMGVNHESYDPQKHFVVSNASCTTNCLAPVVKVLHEEFGIERGLMTTIHSYTNDQRILDLEHKDLRRARAAALSIVPTTTGAAKAIGLVIPDLQGKLNGIAMRVPTPNVSLVDLVAELKKEVTVQEVNESLCRAARGQLAGILEYCELPLVSRDFNGNPHSAIIDALSTMVIEKNMVKVVAWYDNEWGYSNRVVDAVRYMAQKGI